MRFYHDTYQDYEIEKLYLRILKYIYKYENHNDREYDIESCDIEFP